MSRTIMVGKLKNSVFSDPESLTSTQTERDLGSVVVQDR